MLVQVAGVYGVYAMSLRQEYKSYIHRPAVPTRQLHPHLEDAKLMIPPPSRLQQPFSYGDSHHPKSLTGFLRVVISSFRDFLDVKCFPCKRCVSTRARTRLFRLTNPRFLGAWHDYFHIPSWLNVTKLDASVFMHAGFTESSLRFVVR
jgi:hypothetical protein